jgi:hypothetical protein
MDTMHLMWLFLRAYAHGPGERTAIVVHTAGLTMQGPDRPRYHDTTPTQSAAELETRPRAFIRSFPSDIKIQLFSNYQMHNPAVGAVRVLGCTPRELVREMLSRVGFVAQHRPLYRQCTVEQHLQLGARLNARWDDPRENTCAATPSHPTAR